MSAVVQKIEPQQSMALAPPANETAAILNLIERVARDPSVDMDKLVRLLELRDKTEARQRADAFDAAMTEAQREMRAVAADSNNPQTKSRYASYFALDKALRPIYTKHGFSLSFNTGDGAPQDFVRILCRVSRGGHSRDYHIDMPADGKGAKGGDVMTKTHATGSAVSYGSRYLLKMIFNVAVGDADDDGNAAGSGETLNDEQVAEVSALLTETKSNLVAFLKTIKLESLTQIRADKFEEVKKFIRDTAAKRAAREQGAQS